jgi:hypothetical protein
MRTCVSEENIASIFRVIYSLNNVLEAWKSSDYLKEIKTQKF